MLIDVEQKCFENYELPDKVHDIKIIHIFRNHCLFYIFNVDTTMKKV